MKKLTTENTEDTERTKKHISYLRWCKIHDMILNKEHLNPIGLDKITLLSTKVNNHLES